MEEKVLALGAVMSYDQDRIRTLDELRVASPTVVGEGIALRAINVRLGSIS
jgi:hypothetical protein